MQTASLDIYNSAIIVMEKRVVMNALCMAPSKTKDNTVTELEKCSPQLKPNDVIYIQKHIHQSIFIL